MRMGKMTMAMLVGCGAMLVGVLLLPLMGVKLSGILPILLIIACPLSHFVMMAFMGKGHTHGTHCSEEESTEKPPVKLIAEKPETLVSTRPDRN